MGVIKLIHARKFAWQLTGYPKAVAQNGIGRYICQLQRLTFRFCKIRDDSRGVRQFIERDLLDFAAKNPGVVVYLHPVRGQAPYLVGEYLNGRQCSLCMSSESREDMIRYLDYMKSRSGQQIVRFLQNQSTLNPSVQGFWNLFTSVPTSMNVTQFPNDKLNECLDDEITATERLLNLAKEEWPENVKISQNC